MKPVQDVFPQLQAPKKIFITTHHKPDGDAAGSALGLSHYLINKGHQTTVVFPSALPDFLEWMPGSTKGLDFENEEAIALSALGDADFIFCLDFNDFSRTKGLAPHLAAATQPKVMIDHHMFPKPVWDYGISEPHKSSTCEMVYDFIQFAGDGSLIDTDTSTCLYTGVMTDTGSFRFPATTASVHRMIADLKDKGLEHSPIHEAVNDSWSPARMQFIGYMLLNRMELFPKLKAGLIYISREDMKLFGLTTGDTEGLVQYPLSVAGIRFSTLITERSDEIKMSFRSKGDFDVNLFARTHFSGGGHFNASGGRSLEPLLQTISRFKEILSEIHPR